MLLRPVVMRRRPGLLGTMARTAVVAGTATATVGAVRGWQNRKAQTAADQQAAQQAVTEQQQQLNQYPPQTSQVQAGQTLPAAAPANPAESAPQPDLTGELQKLSSLHTAGALTDGEYTAAKTKLLNT